MSKEDIFSVENTDSVVRELLRRETPIHLSSFSAIPEFVVPPTYKCVQLELPPAQYDDSITQGIRKVMKAASEAGFDRQRLHTPIFEACRNAHQHGHKYDSSKPVVVAHNIVPGSLDVLIVDQGGVLDPEFAAFVLYQRQRRREHTFADFYTFAGRQPQGDNHGLGTALIHSTYLDTVEYHKSSTGGLIVHLQKRK